MEENNQNKKEECPLCKVSEETLSILKNTKREKKKEFYKCPECGFWYKEKKWAEKCQAWCKEHKTCNLEIIRHAIKK